MKAGGLEEYCGASVWHDEEGVQPGLAAAERTSEGRGGSEFHYACLQYETGS
jgi:hypothetical protein